MRHTLYTIVIVMAFAVLTLTTSQQGPKTDETPTTPFLESGMATIYYPDPGNDEELVSRTAQVDAGVNSLYQVWRAFAGLPEEAILTQSSISHPVGAQTYHITLCLSREFEQCLSPTNETALIHSLIKTMLENYVGAPQGSTVSLQIGEQPLVTERKNYGQPMTVSNFEEMT